MGLGDDEKKKEGAVAQFFGQCVKRFF